MQFLGLGKTKFNSSICLLDEQAETVELILTERINRIKNSGSWPYLALLKLDSKINREKIIISENRDVMSVQNLEESLDKNFPFFDFLKKKHLDFFSTHYNKEILTVAHHLAHAYAALAMSPFEKSIIIVMDGAGSEVGHNEFEECSVYLQSKGSLKLVHSQSVNFQVEKNSKHTYGNRIGAAYEKIAEFIFNSSHSSGKVMGLAAFSKSNDLGEITPFLESLHWDNAFKGGGKSKWEKMDHSKFKDLAASIQKKLEDEYDKIIDLVKNQFPEINNLILTGGCALNCTNNARIMYQRKFERIFVPPFPGDESIAFGLAHFSKYQHFPHSWKTLPFENQSAYLGPLDSIPTEDQIKNEFSTERYSLQKFIDCTDKAVELLIQNKIIAWFQGRSESGPRALGNRSILARPDIFELRNFLNNKIKFRENFRPYGCSVLFEKAHLYFDVDEKFNNPYMSFAIKIRPEFQETLKEVGHVDLTSRMQTVRSRQNEIFYRLINKFGQRTNLYCLLNTSLNVMDEPILETVADAKRFMDNSPIEYLFIGDYLVTKLF
jgi:carbamoyltransferase